MAFRVIRSLAVVSALFVISLCVYAAEPAPPVCQPVDTPALAPPGVRAFIDPVTGKHRAPTAAELRQIAEEHLRTRRAKISTLVVETHSGGMKSVDLGDAFFMEVVLEKGPDGESRARCAPGSGRTAAASGVPAGKKSP